MWSDYYSYLNDFMLFCFAASKDANAKRQSKRRKVSSSLIDSESESVITRNVSNVLVSFIEVLHYNTFEGNSGKPGEDGEPPKWTVLTLDDSVVHLI